MKDIEFRVQQALTALAAGGMVIVADDDDREAEGDFIMAAAMIQANDVNLMAGKGRGLICVALDQNLAQSLDLQAQSGALHATAFTQSIDYLHGTTTGISCADRALGLRKLVEPATKAADYARPGHLFPLVAQTGGVLQRRGHTEAAVDLCRLAGLPPAGVICEIMNPDGSMARTPQLVSLAAELGMPFLTVDDLATWRRVHDSGLRVGVGARIPTRWGEFTLHALSEDRGGEIQSITGAAKQAGPMLLCYGFDALDTVSWGNGQRLDLDNLLVRVHSECATGDLFGSLRCDCGEQLNAAMQCIAQAGKGALIYLRQEGRGIGLAAKLQAYCLQDQGLDTVDANQALGLPIDARQYDQAAAILTLMGCRSVQLLSNNPQKASALENCGIRVSVRQSLIVEANPHNRDYLETKRQRCGHDLLAAI